MVEKAFLRPVWTLGKMFRSNISRRERGWDTKAEVEAHGFMLKIADPQFIASFQTIRNFGGICQD